MKPHVVALARAGGYELPVYEVRPAPEIRGDTRRVPVVVCGAGLSGLAVAVDLATRGIQAVLLDEDDTVGVRGAASRGIAYARKTLEFLARVGAADPVLARGVTWSVSRTYDLDAQLFSVDLSRGGLSVQPPFVNIQQFYVEAALVDRAYELGVDVRWKNEVRQLQQAGDHVRLRVDTSHGEYVLETQWVIDATGAHSRLREQAGIGIETTRGLDRWCICDVQFETEWPAERRTWIRAKFNERRAVWQHPLPDKVWRLDYQLGANEMDTITESAARRMVLAHVGPERPFRVVWAGPWSYRNQLANRFRSDRVFLIGDAAHTFSPFGGRGGNSGVQDAENLAWKLALVLARQAPEAILDTYEQERRPAAVHNITVTSETGRFLRPVRWGDRLRKRIILALASRVKQVRGMVNTGKLSEPFRYPASACVTAGGHALPDMVLQGPSRQPRIIRDLCAGPIAGLLLLFAAKPEQARATAAQCGPGVNLTACVLTAQAQADDLFDCPALRAAAGLPEHGDAAVLARPDGHVAAVLEGALDPARINEAIARMLCSTPVPNQKFHQLHKETP